ncbi:ABC-2 type transport system ATP-binding protein [Thermocatellispora tengchongensis]|uniref:ABC-2 type transport system ATP-binding protein n=1 Tax=Thermocatellispora tengchongensis TaxID=1073253 RepID=A0A840P6Z7_9ACTN|nr:ABC transporter ATP-binding protein [Thermocatellispora tengchongensis]MBB5133631.1 ABC-2 type transport system ATP-binding protein [Thermocatellispora tengchongensis]
MTLTTAPAIELRGLRKSFGQVRAVDGIDLTVGGGEVVALLGPNGAGKTTTLDMLLGLQPPDSGEIKVLGGSVQDAIRRGKIGAVLQEGELLPGTTVRELIATMSALQPDPMPLDEVIEHAELGGLLQRKTDKLSGGETQRVRFALALVGDPELLVMDEPTAAMDVTARRSFWAAIRNLAAAGRTILFSTHYLEEADTIADRIVLLAAGRVAADGPTTEIRAVAAARVVRFTLPGADRDELMLLPGADGVEVHGAAVTIRSADSDTLLRAMLERYRDARDVEVATAPLADAVFALTERRERDEVAA